MTRIVVTGAAGFIGFHLAQRLLGRGDDVAGIDNLNDYYDVELKRDRLAILERQKGFTFHQVDLCDRDRLRRIWEETRPEIVVNLAAQAGVRYSLINPWAYTSSNVSGFLSVLEACRAFPVRHLVFASSSSVYGANGKMPFSTHDGADHPVSLYAATKRANELMAHTYSHLYAIPSTGLRFFTVYGPWGRPDMALYLFTRAILAGEPISLFNEGKLQRDFTYIDDIIEGVVRVLDTPAQPNPRWHAENPDASSSYAPYRIYNIGSHAPVPILRVVEILEQELGRRAEKRMLPMQPGDVYATYADVDDLQRDTGFAPSTSIEEGIRRFVAWYREYHRV